MAFKMKGAPYPVNRTGKINPNSEGNTDLPDGRSASTTFQKRSMARDEGDEVVQGKVYDEVKVEGGEKNKIISESDVQVASGRGYTGQGSQTREWSSGREDTVNVVTDKEQNKLYNDFKDQIYNMNVEHRKMVQGGNYSDREIAAMNREKVMKQNQMKSDFIKAYYRRQGIEDPKTSTLDPHQLRTSFFTE